MIIVFQELQRNDYCRWVRFAEVMLEILTGEIILIINDEPHFYLSVVDNKSFIIRPLSQELYDRPLYREWRTVWWSISCNFIIILQLFHETVTVITDPFSRCI